MRWLIVAVALVACSARKECPTLPTTKRGPAFLWRAYTPGGDIVWLYGTIHDAGLDAVPRVATDALEKSVRLVTELGDATPDPDVFRKYARITSGPGIDLQLPPDDWYDLRDTLRGSKIKEDDLRRAKPWYAMSLLTTYLVPSPGPSMDVMFVQRARELAMPVEALESWEEQLKVVDGAIGISDLQEAIRARETMRCDLARLRASYEAGATEDMQALLVLPRNEKTILVARNKKWLPKILKLFDQGGGFVAAGLGHMLGDNGLPTLLQREGYTVERTKP